MPEGPGFHPRHLHTPHAPLSYLAVLGLAWLTSDHCWECFLPFSLLPLHPCKQEAKQDRELLLCQRSLNLVNQFFLLGKSSLFWRCSLEHVCFIPSFFWSWQFSWLFAENQSGIESSIEGAEEIMQGKTLALHAAHLGLTCSTQDQTWWPLSTVSLFPNPRCPLLSLKKKKIENFMLS